MKLPDIKRKNPFKTMDNSPLMSPSGSNGKLPSLSPNKSGNMLLEGKSFATLHEDNNAPLDMMEI